jgi:hypothetical protein
MVNQTPPLAAWSHVHTITTAPLQSFAASQQLATLGMILPGPAIRSVYAGCGTTCSHAHDWFPRMLENLLLLSLKPTCVRSDSTASLSWRIKSLTVSTIFFATTTEGSQHLRVRSISMGPNLACRGCDPRMGGSHLWGNRASARYSVRCLGVCVCVCVGGGGM